MGELHIEVITNTKIGRDGGIEVDVGEPIIVYRETITGTSPEIEGKSPNKHNKLYMVAEPMEESVYAAYVDGKIHDEDFKKKTNVDAENRLIEAGLEREQAKKVMCIFNGNMIVNMTKGIVQLDEARELIIA